jgi:hypothetical protein
MTGLTIIKDGVRYAVPPEIEGKGDKAVEAWLQSAAVQESRQESEAAVPAAAPRSRRPKAEG